MTTAIGARATLPCRGDIGCTLSAGGIRKYHKSVLLYATSAGGRLTMPPGRTVLSLRNTGAGSAWHQFVAFGQRLYHRSTPAARYIRVTWLRLRRTEATVQVDFAYGHALPDTTLWSRTKRQGRGAVHRVVEGPAAHVVSPRAGVFAVAAAELQDHGVHDMRVGDVMRGGQGPLYPILAEHLHHRFDCSDDDRLAFVRFLHNHIGRKHCHVEVLHIAV